MGQAGGRDKSGPYRDGGGMQAGGCDKSGPYLGEMQGKCLNGIITPARCMEIVFPLMGLVQMTATGYDGRGEAVN